jgi:hypothetical protein
LVSRGKGRDKEKQKDMRANWVAGVKIEVRKNKGYYFFIKIRGQNRFEGNIATVRWQWHQNNLQAHGDTAVALQP